MGGNNHIEDPKLEEWAKIRETTHLYFRPNLRNSAKGILFMIILPIGLYSLLINSKKE